MKILFKILVTMYALIFLHITYATQMSVSIYNKMSMENPSIKVTSARIKTAIKTNTWYELGELKQSQNLIRIDAIGDRPYSGIIEIQLNNKDWFVKHYDNRDEPNQDIIHITLDSFQSFEDLNSFHRINADLRDYVWDAVCFGGKNYTNDSHHIMCTIYSEPDIYLVSNHYDKEIKNFLVNGIVAANAPTSDFIYNASDRYNYIMHSWSTGDGIYSHINTKGNGRTMEFSLYTTDTIEAPNFQGQAHFVNTDEQLNRD